MMLSVVELLPTLLMYLLILLSALYCWFRWTHRKLLRAAADLPICARTFPLIGHSYAGFWSREGLCRSMIGMTNVAIEKGFKNFVVWCGPLPLITVVGMEDIQMIFNNSNTIDKGDEYEFFKMGLDTGAGELSYGILTAPSPVWRITRKHMNPLFHPQNLQHMIPVFNQNCRELVSSLSEHVGGDHVNLMPYTMDTALKTVCNLLFGPEVQIDIKSTAFKGLMTVVETIPELFVARVLRPWLRIEPLFRFIYGKYLKKLNTMWKNFTEAPLQEAKTRSKAKQLHSRLTNSDSDGLVEPADEPGLLNIVDAFAVLQQSHPEFKEADMWSEILSFYCTGTDTIGSGVASCLLALAQHQDIQERLYLEISRVVGLDDDVTLQDLNRMPYLDQVLKETLRWFTLVPFTLRRTGKDLTLSSCTVPAENTILVSLAGVHMDPQYYKDPQNFDPDRFSPERVGDNERFSFIPFSGGARNCIGKTYAMQLMKIMVVHVMRKYKLRTDMDIFKLRKRLVVTLVSADGYNIRMESRS